MPRPLLRCAPLLLLGACEPSPEARARELFPDRSRELSVERPFRRPADARPDSGRGACPTVLEDVASGTRVSLRGWSKVEERRREGRGVSVSRWQKGYYVPADPSAVSLASGEEYVIRCDRLAGIGVNVPHVRARS